MKKLAIMLCLCMGFGVLAGGCTNTNEQTQSSTSTNSRDVTYEQLGLSYTLPDEWKELEGTQVVQESIRGENTFAQIIYSYLTAEDAATLAEDPTLSIYNYMKPICQIVLSSASEDALLELFSEYNTVQTVGEEQQGYTYYFLSGNKEALSSLEGEDLENYNMLLDSSALLASSIKTQDFDPEALDTLNDELNQYITFDTKSIQGMEVDSTIFGAYDLTMVNFGASYTYPQFDEFEVLEQVYNSRRSFPVDFNLVTAVIDTPGEDAEKAVTNARKDADVSFLTIMMDDTLGSWVLNNLTSIPSTVFVDRDGKIVGEIVEGTKTYEEYMDEVYAHIDVLNGVEPESTEETTDETTDESAQDASTEESTANETETDTTKLPVEVTQE